MLARVGPRLETLNILLTAELSDGASASFAAAEAMARLLQSVAVAYHACWFVADAIRLNQDHRQELCRGIVLLFCAGRAALVRTAAALPAGEQRSSALRQRASALLPPWRLLCAMGACSTEVRPASRTCCAPLLRLRWRRPSRPSCFWRRLMS